MGVNLKNRNNEREYKVGSAAYLKPFDSDSYLTEVPHGDFVSCRLVSGKGMKP